MAATEAAADSAHAVEESRNDPPPTVDPDIADKGLYDVYTPEKSDQPWHVVVSIKEENGDFSHWALLQMLQAKEWDVNPEWAVFQKTGKVGSSGLRQIFKKFRDINAALITFADFFLDKTGNKWLGDLSATLKEFVPKPGKHIVLTPEQGKLVLESRRSKERPRPKLGVPDVPVDVYSRDRDKYQVYVTADGDLWTAIMSIKQQGKHVQYAVLQLLVKRPDIQVEFDYVVFMRFGKLGGSAQRYAKRYTVESGALATFSQWFKEKTANEWCGSFKETLEEFVPKKGMFCLLDRSEWLEVVDFDEKRVEPLVECDVAVDLHYKDRLHYQVYCTQNGDLWAAVMSQKNADGRHCKFTMLQMLAKKSEAPADFEFVVLRRVGQVGEGGYWEAKRLSNETDALRIFKLLYREETGNHWKGSFAQSLAEFEPQAGLMLLLPQSEWDEAVREATQPFIPSHPTPTVTVTATTAAEQQNLTAEQKRTIETLKKAIEKDEFDADGFEKSNTKDFFEEGEGGSSSEGAGSGDEVENVVEKSSTGNTSSKTSKKVAAARGEEIVSPRVKGSKEKLPAADAKQKKSKGEVKKSRTAEGVAAEEAEPGTTPRPKVQAASTEASTPPTKQTADSSGKKKEVKKDIAASPTTSGPTDEVDEHFEEREKFNKVLYSVKMQSADGKKFYVMQLLESSDPEAGRYCFFRRAFAAGKVGTSNHRELSNLETARKLFAKKLQEKQTSEWSADRSLASFEELSSELAT